MFQSLFLIQVTLSQLLACPPGVGYYHGYKLSTGWIDQKTTELGFCFKTTVEQEQLWGFKIPQALK